MAGAGGLAGDSRRQAIRAPNSLPSSTVHGSDPSLFGRPVSTLEGLGAWRDGRRWSAAARDPAADESVDLPEFRTRLTDRYAMKYPIVQAGFSALYVTPELAAAVSAIREWTSCIFPWVA